MADSGQVSRSPTKRAHPDVSEGDPRVQEPEPRAAPHIVSSGVASAAGPVAGDSAQPADPMDQDMLELIKEIQELHAYQLSAVDVSEIFNPGRFASQATAFGLVPGTAFDLRTGWNLSKPKIEGGVGLSSR